MPIYEYKCEKCGHEYEALVMGSEDAVECAKCGSKKKERQMSSFSSGAKGFGSLASSAAASNSGCGGSGFS
ncbi:MAG: zinc ribbon domain-containing protein [Desulfarculaceae bacterium]|nr:zinc ribbon domain-containing protein [Desulfarculaceae bacterium]MCF8073801.1 zinc ribbon domain-containing protein [Desulfarculaceae bacterium]MCF8102042.1 zinc ribbon domain-containing protein [Desulfarculaceae bacterium]MCF8116012.1 zinc ribbon domain-containing protein [Desulfarculaceae bacterium]